ncbi:helix-turn-helix domain-containing protein [Oscillatoria sp. FACHB-1406]|uniref:helix-turn-helix domain-containing protein n=1 Tax=Oscillatoria sp. FACHB-1406 TaxID=2692846 RepID=UPI001686B4C6|nr:helix-turn-helix domain-containing protein [Oscillatoria sp. FACHB-1406]MBD2580129.1 helix-turn-helix domain-containing protein [Oscillatoria sp. FACHB-1406]
MSNPRSLDDRELRLIALYSQCELGMTPQKFYRKWGVTYEQMAEICSRSLSTTRGWFRRGRYYRRPTSNDLRHLALMDFLLEHFEEIPESLWQIPCFDVPKPELSSE